MAKLEKLIEEFVNREVWAIVGYSSDSNKFGHKVYHDLKRAGYSVYAVNRKGGRLNGVEAYRSVLDLPGDVDVVDFVVPPESGMQVARQCADAGLRRIWLQPGAESGELLSLCNELGLTVVWDHCAMVEKTRRKKRDSAIL